MSGILSRILWLDILNEPKSEIAEKRNQGKQYLFLSLNRIKISRIAKVSIYLKILSEIFLFSLFK